MRWKSGTEVRPVPLFGGAGHHQFSSIQSGSHEGHVTPCLTTLLMRPHSLRINKSVYGYINYKKSREWTDVAGRAYN
jgi:hypothetical protein